MLEEVASLGVQHEQPVGRPGWVDVVRACRVRDEVRDAGREQRPWREGLSPHLECFVCQR